MAHVLLLLSVSALLFALFRHHSLKHECRYCGGQWGGHEAHCPYNHAA